MLFRLLDENDPAYFCVVFDAPGGSFRNKLYAEYKAQRSKMPDELREQIEPLHEIIDCLKFKKIILPDVEADDVIGTLAQLAQNQGLEVMISTSDKDMAQLVNEKIYMVNSANNIVLDQEGVKNKFGVRPDQIIDYLTLIGDQSDNIPGVPGIGPKTAKQLLDAYQTLDGITANLDKISGKKAVVENIKQHLEHLPLYKALVTIDTKLPIDISIDDFQREKPDLNQLIPLLEKFELTQIKNRFTTNNIPKNIPLNINYQSITNEEVLIQHIKEIETIGSFSINTEVTELDYMNAQMVGYSFSYQANESYYVPLCHAENTAQLTLEIGLKHLKKVIENKKIIKIGHNLKHDAHILKNHGINLHGRIFDTLIQSFLIDSSLPKRDLPSLAKIYLNKDMLTYECVAGKGAKQISFHKVPIALATQYAAEDASIAFELQHKLQKIIQSDLPLAQVYEAIDEPLVMILNQIERSGVFIDKNQLEKQSQGLTTRLQKLEEEVFKAVGESFNLSSPKQLQKILYEVLDLPILGKTPGGQPSTSESVLHELSLDYELPKKILEHRSLAKLKTTYTDKLPHEINIQTGRVHTSYHQANVITGRLSSSSPNLQNIPIKSIDGRKIRLAFVAPKGKILIAADYSQIELRILAHLSKDENLIRAFKDDLDIHTLTASQILNVKIEDITSEQRRNAKAVNFGIIYGMSAFGLAKQIGVFQSEAKQYIENYFAQFPKVHDYLESTKGFAKQNNYVETILNRKLRINNINSSNFNLRQYAERSAINAPMQGSASDIIKLAMKTISQTIYRKNILEMVMQVHDELVFEADLAVADVAAEEIKNIMENVIKLSVPLKVEVGLANNWDEAH
jgi:DNA polymerase I